LICVNLIFFFGPRFSRYRGRRRIAGRPRRGRQGARFTAVFFWTAEKGGSGSCRARLRAWALDFRNHHSASDTGSTHICRDVLRGCGHALPMVVAAPAKLLVSRWPKSIYASKSQATFTWNMPLSRQS